MADYGRNGIRRWDQGLQSTQIINGQSQPLRAEAMPKNHRLRAPAFASPRHGICAKDSNDGNRIKKHQNHDQERQQGVSAAVLG